MPESARDGRAPSAGPAPAELAATILLVRQRQAGLEVFLLQRHDRIDFARGAMVFPGGRVDAGDRDPRLRGRSRGLEGIGEDAAAVRLGAIRETFEECGVLLARPRGEEALVGAGRVADLERRCRADLAAGRVSLAEIAEREDLALACDLLVPFAHWVTPEFMPRRFDTHFFLAAAPEDQAALHDGEESVDSVWTTPSAALADRAAGRRTIIFPTLLNLRKLGESASVAEALERARRSPVVTVLPRMERDAGGARTLRIPPEAGYTVLPSDLAGELPSRELP
jgi:8-oxo-dGTP pyrophosphatase MutT (NUDIX family)